MENLSIFDFLNVEGEELYAAIQQLHINDLLQVNGYEVRRTEKFYEVESDAEHLPFRTVEECSRYLLKMMAK